MFSGPILIGRGLNQDEYTSFVELKIQESPIRFHLGDYFRLCLCSCESALSTFNNSGDNGERDPPVLIPNTEVKPFRAESTELETAWKDRALPDINLTAGPEKVRRQQNFIYP